MMLRGRVVKAGKASGAALVSSQPISFLGGVNPATGVLTEPGHELQGQCVKGRVLVFPHGKGSTAGSYVIYQLARNGTAPSAIVVRQAEPIVAVGALMAGIPMVHRLDADPIKAIRTGDLITVDGEIITVERG